MAVSKKKTPAKKPRKPVAKKKAAPKKRVAHNKKMTLSLFEKVSKELETSRDGLDKICKRLNSSATAYYNFRDNHKDNTLHERYARARENQSHYFNDLIVEVAFDDADDEKPFVGANHIQRDRLKIQALETASKRANPKKYGDKVDVTTDGDKIENVTIFKLPENNRE